MDSTMREAFCKLRLQLFEELGEINSYTDINSLEKATKDYYYLHIDKDLISWGVKFKGQIVATASLCLFSRIPYEQNKTGVEGYILNIYTKPEYRKQGIAKCLVEEIIKFANEKQIKRLWLDSSEQGMQIYIKYGFRIKNNSMELYL